MTATTTLTTTSDAARTRRRAPTTATAHTTEPLPGRTRRTDNDSSPLGVARTAFALLTGGALPLTLDTRRYAGLPNRDLPLPELRTRLLARSCPKPTRDAVWAELVSRSRTQGAAWTVACVGMAMPALSRLARDLCAAFAGDTADVHAEILRGFLTGLTTLDLGRPSVMTRLRWHAYRGGHAAVRDALDAPTPLGCGFDSTPPPPTAGHPDFVLARAVAAGAISRLDAEVIGETRLEDVPLRDWAETQGISYVAARQVRSRGERRLLVWLASQEPGIGAVELEPGRLEPDTTEGASVSHLRPGRGVGGCRRTPHTPTPANSPGRRPEEPRCA